MSNSKSKKFGTWTLNDIVAEGIFRVPDYQRGYAWTERQLEEFWEDVSAVAESGRSHYTGAITVERIGLDAGMASRECFEVVDGQQRLTTAAILLAALKGDDSPMLLKECGDVKFVFSYGDNSEDRCFLENILLGKECGNAANSHQRNLQRAKEFFKSKTSGLGEEEAAAIFNAVMAKLAFDFRILGSDFDAGVVFETMNNRGKPLTLLEKLKNRLMYLANGLKADGDEAPEDAFERESLCQDINEVWGEIYRQLASNPNADPLDEDEFVAAHLSVYRNPKERVYSESVAESRLFKMFCIRPEKHPKSESVDEHDDKAMAKAKMEEPISLEKIRDYVEDLGLFAKPWAEIHSDFTGAMGRCRLLSGTREVKVFLVTVLLHVKDENLRNSIFECAEKLLFRNTIQTVLDDASFATLARRLHGKCLDMLKKSESGAVNAEGILESLNVAALDERHQISTEKLAERFSDGFYGWGGLKYFLFKMEGENGLPWSGFEGTSIEHVIPQSAARDDYDGWWTRQVREFAPYEGQWRDLDKEEKKLCRQRRHRLVNSLGNFVLLTQSENASISDDPWEGYPAVAGKHKAVAGKKAFYADMSRTSSAGAREVAQIAGSWNAFRIRERGHKLFQKLAEMVGCELLSSDIDSVLGFGSDVAIQDTIFNRLPEIEVDKLAPKFGTAAEPQQVDKHKAPARNETNIAFWTSFKRWCGESGRSWCVADIATRGNPYYDPEGAKPPLHVFITIGRRSASISKLGPLVTIGIYCREGESQRQRLKCYKSEFEGIGEFQDWTCGQGGDGAKRICFIRRLDWSHPTPQLFKQMADDYESVRAVLRRHGAF